MKIIIIFVKNFFLDFLKQEKVKKVKVFNLGISLAFVVNKSGEKRIKVCEQVFKLYKFYLVHFLNTLTHLRNKLKDKGKKLKHKGWLRGEHY